MKLLLDTHIVLWYITDDQRLPVLAREMINNPENEVYYSMVSLWEVAIKHQISSQRMPVSDESFSKFAEASGLLCMQLKKEHIAALKTLNRKKEAKEHHDPFDRMLISQAKQENVLLITHDSALTGYDEACILYV